jgi:hypothetical protein
VTEESVSMRFFASLRMTFTASVILNGAKRNEESVSIRFFASLRMTTLSDNAKGGKGHPLLLKQHHFYLLSSTLMTARPLY